MSNADLDRFALFIARVFGLDFSGPARQFLAVVLRQRLAQGTRTAASYLDGLEGAGRDELRLLARELTVTETSFFRNTDHMRVFAEMMLADRAAARAGQGSLRILSAGCASGEEAHSLAILARQAAERHALGGLEISIQGLDINNAALRKAAGGRYSPWSLRQTPPDIRARFFQADGNGFALSPDIRRQVRFEERNLTTDDPAFWQPGAFDIVFCRNVIMYFAPSAATQVIARIAHSLTPGGFLFLGHAENLRGLSTDFELCHTHGAFYYRRKAAAPAAIAAPEDWAGAIAGASQRIRALGAPRAGIPAPALDVAQAVELIGRENFTAVAAMLDALPPPLADGSEALLLAAMVLTGGGDLARAESICAELLRRDPADAGAHYLMALCRESAGDNAAAATHDRLAAGLDADFAMPRLHLGMLARRAGKPEKACRELAQALALLEREKPSRLALFGGGFSREMLIRLCRAELQGCGEAA